MENISVIKNGTAKQSEIHKRLSNIGPEIAAFYYDAILISKSNQFKTVSNLLGHLAREIDSGLRDILEEESQKDEIQKKLSSEEIQGNFDFKKFVDDSCKELKKSKGPIASILPSFDLEKLVDDYCDKLKKSKGHIASILSSLDTDLDSKLAKDWILIVILFHKYAHRHGAWKDVRPPDAMKKLWGEWEEVLYEIIEIIDDFYCTMEKSIEKIRKSKKSKIPEKLKSFLKRQSRRRYFFRTLKQTGESTFWLKHLHEAGYFKPNLNSEPVENDHILSSDVFGYLEHVAIENQKSSSKEISDCLTEIVNDIVDYRKKTGERIKNPLTDWFLIEIIFRLPINSISEDHIKFTVASLPQLRHVAFSVIEELIFPTLIAKKKVSYLLQILEFVLDDQKDTNHQSQVLKENRAEIAKLCPLEAAEIAIKKINALELSIYCILNPFESSYHAILFLFLEAMYQEADPKDIKDKVSQWAKSEKFVYIQLACALIKFHKELQCLLNEPKIQERYEDYEPYNFQPDYTGSREITNDNTLQNMSNSEIVDYINNFKGDRYFNIENAFRNLVGQKPSKITDEIKLFQSISRRFQVQLLSGLKHAWKEGKTFDWEALLDFISGIINSDTFWKEEDDQPINDRNDFLKDVSRLLEEGLKDDKHAFDPKLLPIAEKILFQIARNLESDRGSSDISDIQTDLFNSPKGVLFSAMVSYSLRCARLNKKAQSERWTDSIRIDFTKRLDTEKESAFIFVSTLGFYLNTLWYLDKEWIRKNISNIFPINNFLYWKASFSSYLIGYRLLTGYRFQKDIYELLKSKGHYRKALKELDDKTDKELVDHICNGYLEDWESLDDPNSSISFLAQELNPTRLSKVLWFFLDYPEKEKIKSKVKPLWKAILDRMDKEKMDTELSELRANLSNWLVFIDEIDDQIYEWLKLSVKSFSRKNHYHFTDRFIKALADKVERFPEKVGKIYLEILNKEIFPRDPEEEIEKIARTIFSSPYHKFALKICNMYGENGHDFLRNLYESHKQKQN
ncbi:MAG: hypothetical protein B6244_10065 [Candidatus Cloacimonetes bacterium 4572_55]|nr:MAG: hypothetical protein B6244_10065 [Candidatus Cloacimonetes bacterium 4572_55]